MAYTDRHGRPAAAEKLRPVWQLVLQDLLLTGLVLCVFAFFHHVLPRIRQELSGPPEPIATAAPTPVSTAAPETPETPGPSPTPDPDDWRALFAEHFSDRVQESNRSYTSPDISIEITDYADFYEDGNDSWPVVYHVADIYVADIGCFRSIMSSESTYAGAESIVEENRAILALNGDFAQVHPDGISLRNGELYAEGVSTADILVLYYNGEMETYSPQEQRDGLPDLENAYQIWRFGPSLLDSEGQVQTEFNIGIGLLPRHPRSAVGYYEPGHYCFVTVDGRGAGGSKGLPMQGLAQLMEDLGCVRAYNLDGGASSQMLFSGELVNTPSGERSLCDMLAICELPGGQEGEEP